MSAYAPRIYCVGKTNLKKDVTYLGYKKTAAFAELKKNIMSGLLDKALFWAVEIDISGAAARMYENLCQLAANEINITNPNLPSLLFEAYQIRFNLVKDEKRPEDMLFHDYQILRNHLVQLVAVLTLSPKAKLAKVDTWKKDQSMDLLAVKDRMRRKNLNEITDIVKINDQKDVYIPLNEIDWSINSSKNVSQAKSHFLYWLGWLVEMEKRFPNKQYCANREVPDVPDNCLGHCAWPIWQIIFKRLEEGDSGMGLKNSVVALYKLFRTGYSKAKRKTRLCYLIYAAQLIIGSIPVIDFSTPLFPNLPSTLLACANANQLYKKMIDQKREDKADHNDNNISHMAPKDVLYVPIIKS